MFFLEHLMVLVCADMLFICWVGIAYCCQAQLAKQELVDVAIDEV